jgi:hypothetical protein
MSGEYQGKVREIKCLQIYKNRFYEIGLNAQTY